MRPNPTLYATAVKLGAVQDDKPRVWGAHTTRWTMSGCRLGCGFWGEGLSCRSGCH